MNSIEKIGFYKKRFGLGKAEVYIEEINKDTYILSHYEPLDCVFIIVVDQAGEAYNFLTNLSVEECVLPTIPGFWDLENKDKLKKL